MRLKRVKNLEEVSYYHCICRCVGLERHLEVSRDKGVLHEMIWRAADFSGVRVITYCIMDDHFHLLIRVPPKSEVISEEEIFWRYRGLYHSTPGAVIEFARMLKERGIRRDLKIDRDETIEAIINNLQSRMHDVSEFMKTLKQRFTQWYNKTHERVGTLWTERFKSLIVEDNPHLLATLAAYIEMNPVRAGICEKAQDYHWCGIRDFLDCKGIYSTLRVAEDQVRNGHHLESQSFAGENKSPHKVASPRDRQTYDYEFYRYTVMPLVEEIQAEFTEEKRRQLEVSKKTLNSGRREALESMNLPLKTLLMGRLRHLAEGVAIGSVLFLQILASTANGAGYGRIPLHTGFQVDEELKLMCLSRIRGPKIE